MTCHDTIRHHSQALEAQRAPSLLPSLAHNASRGTGLSDRKGLEFGDDGDFHEKKGGIQKIIEKNQQILVKVFRNICCNFKETWEASVDSD